MLKKREILICNNCSYVGSIELGDCVPKCPKCNIALNRTGISKDVWNTYDDTQKKSIIDKYRKDCTGFNTTRPLFNHGKRANHLTFLTGILTGGHYDSNKEASPKTPEDKQLENKKSAKGDQIVDEKKSVDHYQEMDEKSPLNSDDTKKCASKNVQIQFNRKEGYPFEIVNSKFVSIDFETTGLLSEDRIIEVGAVLFENRIPTRSYSSLVNPGISIPEKTSEYNHITDEMISTAPSPDQVIKELIEFIGHNNIVAYNADFDIGFFKRELKRLEIEYTNDYYDVYEMVKNYYRGDFPDRKQSTIATHMGIKVENSHRAFSDAEICGEILVNLEPWLERYEEYDRLARKQYEKDRTPTEEQRELGAIIHRLIQTNNGYYYLIRYKVFKNRLYLHCRKEEITFLFSENGITIDVPIKYASDCETYVVHRGNSYVTIRISNPFDVNIIENYILDITNKVGEKYVNLSERSMERADDEIESSGYEIRENEVPDLLKNAKERYEYKVVNGIIKKEKENLKTQYDRDEFVDDRKISVVQRPTGIDPKRVMRAKQLSVSRHGNDYLVSGGFEPHLVKPGKEYTCDCKDFEAGTHFCKHILAVMIENGEIDSVKC